MSEKKEKRFGIIKTNLVITVFLGHWYLIHRGVTINAPPSFFETILIYFLIAITGIFTLYYLFIHKLGKDEKPKALNWRQLFVIGMLTLHIIYRVYITFEEIERGLKEEMQIVSRSVFFIIFVIIVSGLAIFLLRDKKANGDIQPEPNQS